MIIGFVTQSVVDRICGLWLSLCVCVRLASRVSRLSASVSRLRAFVSRASRVCVHLSRVHLASACICLACVSRLSASVHVKGSECVRLRLSRVSRRSSCLASASASVSRLRLSRICLRASVSRLSRVCLASVVLSRVCLASVVLSRVCLSPCECLRELAHFMRRSSFKEFKRFFAIVILSYNVPMPKYPSHHLIYVFYHPMPIMPLY